MSCSASFRLRSHRLKALSFPSAAAKGGLHTLAVVTPYRDSAMEPRVVAGEREQGTVRLEGVHQNAAAQTVRIVAYVKQHDAAVSDCPRLFIVPALLAALTGSVAPKKSL